ncbi:MAG: helix-turn-helix transcriptional regulator [Lachnospiraceae bacterium]
MNIGTKIKTLRKEKNMTLQQIAYTMGCSPQLISQYESGKRIPKLETIQKIAVALGVPISELVSSDVLALTNDMIELFSNNNVQHLGSSEPNNSQEYYLISKFRNLNEKGQQKAINYIEDISQIQAYKKKDYTAP